MPKLSAGLIVYKHTKDRIEVFLAHPGGPFWAKKDAGAWSIPKGEYTEDEEVLAAAKREFAEEIGVPAPEGDFIELGDVKYGNKRVTAWAVQGQVNPAELKSNLVTLQWPPKSGQTIEFSEVDKAAWFTLDKAKQKLVKGQVSFIERLAEKLQVASHPADQDDSLQLQLF
jgi:predicted NUDIX family NTP pyrophosphohydrolase